MDGWMEERGSSRESEELADFFGGHRCIIVDSTRRGKSMPDALAKTVPIWCAVLNRALFPERGDCRDVWLPEEVVSGSERQQISGKVEGWVREFEVCGLME